MESFFGRYKNPLVLMAVLFIQVIALATQVKRPTDSTSPNSPGTRLIRVWTVTAFTPVERAFVGTGHFFRNGWHNYVDLHDVRKQNQELQAEITRLRMEEVHLKQDAQQAQRLQVLLGFRERFVGQTLAAQVIGTSGSEQSRVIYIDKGLHDGIKPDMAVITPDGIVGKIKDVFPLSSQVLMINDRDSGAGVILEKSRLQGVLRGGSTGELRIDGIMAGQDVQADEQVLASGGDRIYPKGFPVGTVSSVAPDRDTGTFLNIKIKPAADLNRLEEVLVVTRMAEQTPAANASETQVRAADILAERLPTVPKTSPPQGAPGANGLDEKKKPQAPGSADHPVGSPTQVKENAQSSAPLKHNARNPSSPDQKVPDATTGNPPEQKQNPPDPGSTEKPPL
jgi:rod shape-determining protein MreC